MIFVFGALVGLAIGLWSVGGLLKYRREQQDQLSEAWVQDRAKVDGVTSQQWDGVVWRWPDDDYDDAA